MRTQEEAPLVVEELTLELLLPWFKEQEQEHLLREPGKIAVLLRGGAVCSLPNGDMVQAVYCTMYEKIVHGRRVRANRLTEDVSRMFGDKDMVVFQ